MTEADRILIQILARTDAVFRPQRRDDWSGPASSNLYAARQQFLTAGVTLSTGGGDEGERKAAQRLLLELSEGGLVTLAGGERRKSAKLTDRAEHYTRSLCGLPSLADAHHMTRKVIRLAATGGGLTLTREYWLTRFQKYVETAACKQALWNLSETLAPALCRGFVESRSDCLGRAYYTATAAGRAWAKLPAPKLLGDLPEYDAEARDLYSQETLAARAMLRTAKPTSGGEIGECPLPASLELRRPRTRKARA